MRLHPKDQHKFVEHRGDPELCIFDQAEVTDYQTALQALRHQLTEQDEEMEEDEPASGAESPCPLTGSSSDGSQRGPEDVSEAEMVATPPSADPAESDPNQVSGPAPVPEGDDSAGHSSRASQEKRESPEGAPGGATPVVSQSAGSDAGTSGETSTPPDQPRLDMGFDRETASDPAPFGYNREGVFSEDDLALLTWL